jgi:hypothetical protein
MCIATQSICCYQREIDDVGGHVGVTALRVGRGWFGMPRKPPMQHAEKKRIQREFSDRRPWRSNGPRYYEYRMVNEGRPFAPRTESTYSVLRRNKTDQISTALATAMALEGGSSKKRGSHKVLATSEKCLRADTSDRTSQRGPDTRAIHRTVTKKCHSKQTISPFARSLISIDETVRPLSPCHTRQATALAHGQYSLSLLPFTRITVASANPRRSICFSFINKGHLSGAS